MPQKSGIENVKEGRWYWIWWRGFSGRVHKIKRRVRVDDLEHHRFVMKRGTTSAYLPPAIAYNIVRFRPAPLRKKR